MNQVPREAIPWPNTNVRRASVSSFGFGGTNVHIVLDNAPNRDELHDPRTSHMTLNPVEPVLLNGAGHTSAHDEGHLPNGLVQDVQGDSKILVWSMADKDGAARIKSVWEEYFASVNVLPKDRLDYLNDLAFTLSMRRSFLEWRAFAVVQPGGEWNGIVENMSPPTRSIASPNVAYIFTGVSRPCPGCGKACLFILNSKAPNGMRWAVSSWTRILLFWAVFVKPQHFYKPSDADGIF